MRNGDSFLKTYRVTAHSLLITLRYKVTDKCQDVISRHRQSTFSLGHWVMTQELLHFVVQKCHLEINLIIILRVRLQSINDTGFFISRKDRNYPSLSCEVFRIFDDQLRKITLVCLRQWELKPSIMTHIRDCNYDCHSTTIWVKHASQGYLLLHIYYETVLCHGRLFPLRIWLLGGMHDACAYWIWPFGLKNIRRIMGMSLTIDLWIIAHSLNMIESIH